MKIFQSEESQNSLRLLLQIGAVVVTLLLPYFYVIGLAYYDGKMSARGLSASAFPLTTADIYVEAFFAVMLVVADTFRNIADFFGFDVVRFKQTLGILLCVFGVVAALDRFENSEFYSKLKNKQSSKGINGTASKVLNSIVYSFSFLVFLIFFLVWGIVLATNAGRESVIKEIKAYIESGCFFDKDTHWNNCYKLIDKNGEILHEGLLIAKTENEVAFFEKNQTLVLKLNQDVSIVRTRK